MAKMFPRARAIFHILHVPAESQLHNGKLALKQILAFFHSHTFSEIKVFPEN